MDPNVATGMSQLNAPVLEAGIPDMSAFTPGQFDSATASAQEAMHYGKTKSLPFGQSKTNIYISGLKVREVVHY
jgi:hypothetical protein